MMSHQLSATDACVFMQTQQLSRKLLQNQMTVSQI